MNFDRAAILDEAKRLTCGERDATYGPPTEDYRDVAALWSALLARKLKEPLTASEAAWCMVLLKARRHIHNPGHMDSVVDAVAYAGIAGECAGEG